MTNSAGIPWDEIAQLASPWVSSTVIEEGDRLILKHAEDEKTAMTVVSFRGDGHTVGIGGRLTGVLLVETRLSWPEASDSDLMLAMLNAHAALGAAVLHDGGALNLFSRFSIYEQDGSSWRIFAPLVALSAATNIQVFGTSVSDATRSPRVWPQWPDRNSAWTEKELSDVALRLNSMGVVSFASKDGLTAEFPWEDGATSAASVLTGDRLRATTLLEMSNNAVHPLLGAGLLCTLQLPLPRNGTPRVVGHLNSSELGATNAPPSFGAWCANPRGGHPTYVSFLPNLMHGLGIEHNIAAWMLVRTQLAKRWLE